LSIWAICNMAINNYLKKSFKQSFVYFASTFIASMLSLVSFPIWTRIFTVAEYGRMSLTTTTLSLMLVFSKLGIQHAVLRFYYEFKNHKRNIDISYLYTTALLVVIVLSIAISTLYLLIIDFVLRSRLEQQFATVLHILPLLLTFGTVTSIFLTFYRSEQNAKLYSVINVSLKYARFGSSLVFVFIFKLGLIGFFLGWAFVDSLYAIVLVIIFFKQKKIRFGCVSLSLFKEAISYGLPLLGFELAYILLISGDRYLVQFFMDSAAVGIYSASYNMVDYSISFFYMPLRLAIMPIYMKLWEEKGEQETRKFLSDVQNFYFMIAIPIIWGMISLGRELITLLASSKYESGYIVIPYIVIGSLLYYAHFIYGAGFYLKKKTKNLLAINITGIVFNLLLNIIMIPLWGISGAAIATLVTYILMAAIIMRKSFVFLKIDVNLIAISKFMLASILMYIVLEHVNLQGLVSFFLKIGIGILIYFFTIIIIDKNIRDLVSQVLFSYHQRSQDVRV